MPFFVYILKSAATGRHYCGQTSDLDRRVSQHNDPCNQLTKTTKRFQGPWHLVWSRECGDRREAMRLERKIKKRGISRYLAESRQRRD
ncbi:MAG: GIY-YIG nuclease family protein [Pseudomonadota bacterium]